MRTALFRRLPGSTVDSRPCVSLRGMWVFSRVSRERWTRIRRRCVRQWTRVLRQLGAFGRTSIFLREDGDSDPEVDFVLLSRGIQSMFQLLCRGVRTWKSGYYFHEPLVFDSHVFAVRACR